MDGDGAGEVAGEVAEGEVDGELAASNKGAYCLAESREQAGQIYVPFVSLSSHKSIDDMLWWETTSIYIHTRL